MEFQPPRLGVEHVFSASVTVGPVDDYGVTAAGHRRVVPILGGVLTGSVSATILPGGADWQLVHEDGRVEIDTRYSARTASGSLMHLRTQGARSGPPAVLQALLAGDRVPPTDYYFRLIVRVETSDAQYRDLQDHLLIASAVRDADRVRYDAYRVL